MAEAQPQTLVLQSDPILWNLAYEWSECFYTDQGQLVSVRAPRDPEEDQL